jgi:DNA-binding transcriptional MerR regulator
MTTERLHSIADAAALANISPSTVRNWTGQFAAHFSEHATPEPGRERLLNDRDVAVLQAIAELRNQRKSFEEIAEQLPSLHIEPTDLYVTVEPTEPARIDASPQLDVPAALAIVNAIDERYGRLESHLRTFEERVAGKATWFAFGVCVGLIMGLIAAMLFGV